MKFFGLIIVSCLVLFGCASAPTNGKDGAPGAKGDTGATGAPGPKGEPGSVATTMTTPGTNVDDSKITASIGCSATLQNTVGMSFTYNVDQFANGNVFVTANIADAAKSSSFSEYYAPTQNGFATAPINITLDEFAPNDSGWWSVSLDRSTLVVSIVYHDADVAGGGSSWTLTPDKCVVNSY